MDRLKATWMSASSLPVKSALALPLQAAWLSLKYWQGKETSITSLQRLGLSYDSRTPGPLIWFHASTLGECAVALPVLFRCLLEYNEKVAVMLTTASVEAYNMLRSSLPARVIVQMMPLDNAVCVSLFMRRWRPTVGILVESPFSPQLVLLASAFHVRLALINAHIEPSDLLVWHAKRHLRSTLGSVLEQFALIIPQSDVDVGRFRIFGATMKQMPGWCNELKYAALMGNSVWHLWKPPDLALLQLKGALAGRPTWLAANTVHGEEEVVGRLHLQIAPQLHAARQPGLVTVVVPQDSGRCAEVAALYAGELGLRVALWSMQDTNAYADMDILLVDDARQLPMFYRLCEVTLMGNSLLEGCTGHSLAQAAVAGTAVLLGSYAGSSEHMAEELNNAAVMAAEDAAAAVRSTGQVMDDGGWDEHPASPARSPTHTANSATDIGQDDRNHSSTTFGNSMRMESRLSQRHSGTGTFSGRPSTAPPTTTRPLLASQFSQLGQFMPESPRTPMSEADSLCSETSPHQAVRHFFGSANSGTLSVHMTMGASPRASPRAMAMTAFLRESPRTGGSMNVFGTSLATRGPVAHTTTEWLSPRPSQQQQQQPQTGMALLHPRPSSTAGSLPASPLAVRGTQDLAGSSRRWERMFSAVEDVVPWSEGVAPISRSGTPSAAASSTHASSVFSPSPGAPTAASPRTPSPQAMPASPTRSTTPTDTLHSTSSTPTKQLQDSSTQTEHELVVDNEHMGPASLPMVMLAAMVGAIGGVQMVQSPHAATHSPRLAPRPKPPVGSSAPNRRPETFTPFVHTLHADDRGEASLSGMPNMPLRMGSPKTGSPTVSSGGHHPARIAANNGTHPTAHHSRLSTAVSASSPVAGSLCDSPMGTARSSSFVDDPVLERRAQRLKLRLNHSTWTAASTPDRLSPRPTGTTAPHTSPGLVSATQHSGRSQELMAALEAMVDDDSALNTAMSPGGSVVHNSMQAQKGAHSHSAASTTDWLTDPWGVGDGEDGFRAGPELSSRSAPLLNRSSFEFDLNGSPSFQAQQQRNAENDNALTLHTASSLAAPVANNARHQPSRLALASGVMSSPFQARLAECDLPSPESSSPPSAPLQTQDSATREPPAPIWSPTKLPLTMRAPPPSTGLNHHNSATSSRSSAGLYHSDPGSPSCSQPSSSARSERHWGRSDSGSPTNPLRVSVAGWMGDFGHPSILSAATLRSTASAAPCTRSNLPEASQQQASSSTVNVPLRTVQEALVLTPSGSGSVPSNIVGSSIVFGPNTDQDFSLSPRSSAAASPAAAPSINTASAAVAIELGKASIMGLAGSYSPSDSLSSVGHNGSLRNVRTPRAVEAEPARAWSNSTLPPVSPRASIAPPMSPRASVVPPMSPRASMAPPMSPRTSMVPPLSPRASGMPPMSPRASVMPPASPRSPGVDPKEPFSSITIAELQALAANHVPDLDDEGASPETPTSRMSILHGATSPFANTTFDRPNPFANGHGLPSRLDSATADALSDTLMASLAQAQGEWTRSSDERSPPATPTSRLSAMNSVTSPFATSTFDRPNPFAPDAPGPEARAGSLPGMAVAVGDWQRLQPQLERSDSGSSSGKTTPPRRSPSWVIQQRAAIDLVNSSSGDLGQQLSRSHMTAFSSGRPAASSLAPLPEGSTVFLTANLGSDSGASTPPSNASSLTAAAAFAHALEHHESPRQSGAQGRALSRFFSQSARKREAEQVAGEDLPLATHMSAGQATSVDESEPETPRFRPRNSQDFRTRNSFDTQASSSSSNWYHSTPQLQFTEQLLDAPHSTTAITMAEGPPIGQRNSTAPDADIAGLISSPCKTITPLSRSASRAAYQVQDAAAECCAGLEPGSTAALSILTAANATVQAMTSLGVDTDPATDIGSSGLQADVTLSPRSPFRQLFDDNGHPTPTHTFACYPVPATSNEQPDSSSADSLGTDLLTCLASILGEGEGGSGADELGHADAEPSSIASGGMGQMTAEERAKLLATTERLVAALEASLDQGASCESPASLGPPGTLQVQAALQDLLAVLGPCTAGVLHCSASSGNLSASSSSGQFEHLFEHFSGELRVTSASFAAMPEYSLGIQSMSMAAAMDAAVVMAGFAGVVGASQAGEEDGFAWERVKLRVSTVNLGASASCNGLDTAFSQLTLGAAAPDSVNGAIGRSGSGSGSSAEEMCGEVTGRCDVPPHTTPLVMPGVNGPVLVAAPLALVSRLSQSHAPISIPAAPVTKPKDSMADILLAMPSLPQLRLPQCQGSGGGGGSATARAGGSESSTALYPTAPSTAPAHAAYGRMPTLGDDTFPSTGSSQHSNSSEILYPTNAVHVSNAALGSAAVMHRSSGATGSSSSLASLFAFAAPVAATQPSNTSSAAGTPDAAHPAPAATLSPGLHARTPAVGTGEPIHGLPLPLHQPAPVQAQSQSLAPVALVSPTGLGWQPAAQDSSWPAGVTVLLPEESADKAVRSRANTATLTHARAQPAPAPAPGNAPSAYSAINPGVAVAHKVAGASSTATSSNSASNDARAGRATSQQQQQQQVSQQQDASSGGALGHRTAINTSQPSASSLDHRSVQQQQQPPAHTWATSGQHFVLPATQLSRSTGPAVWHMANNGELAGALLSLLSDPLERRSRGHAAAQAAAKLASGLVNTVWHVLDESVITPALHGYVQTQPGSAAAVGTHRT